MIINLSDDQDEVKIPKKAITLLKKGLQAVAEIHGLSEKTEVSVSLVSDEVIHVLNKNYRGIDRPTDVLSFALDEAEEPEETGGPEQHLLGDIIISAETAVRQGKEYGHGLNRELVYLGVHSLLHLLGYDHMNRDDKVKMRAEEEKALQKISLSQEDLDQDGEDADPVHFAATVINLASEKKEGTEDNVAASKAGKKEKAERSGKKAEKKDRKLRMRQNDVKRMDKTTQGLLKKALKARENAYVPFSRFKVGAALLTKEGDVFTGCNIENSSFGLTVCAERTAIFTAASNGVRPGEISVLLVVADTDDVTSPCGACRQVMAEFEIPIVIMANIKGDVRKISLEELLPFGFKAADFS